MGSDGAQLLFDLFVYVQPFNEVLDRGFGDGLVGARQRFQCFVGMRVAFSAQDGLDGLGHHAPAVVQVL